MRLLAAFRFEMTSLIRHYLSSRWVRWGVLGVGGGLAIAACVAVSVVPAPAESVMAERSPAQIFTGFIVINLGVSTAVAIAGVTRIVQNPTRAQLLRLAPLSPSSALWVRFGPIITAALLPLLLFYAPVVIISLRMQSLQAGILMIGMGVAVVAWATQFALWAVLTSVNHLGREDGLKVANVGALAIGMISILGFNIVRSITASMATWALFLAATVTLLPVWSRHTGSLFAEAMQQPGGTRSSAPPPWGRLTVWRTVKRSPAVFRSAGMLLALALVMAFDVPFQHGMIAVMIQTVATIPLYHVFQPEYECPIRLQMAPRGTLFKIRMLVAAGGPFTALALGLLLFAGWGSWLWVVSVSGLTLLMVISYLLANPVLRTGVQIVLMGAAFATQWVN